MASRIMHLACGVQLLDVLPDAVDASRFLTGELLPDCAPGARAEAHFLTRRNGLRTYDVQAFRQKFADMLLQDGIVLGYYLHLVQDLVFRRFMYAGMGFDPRREGYLAGLHSDYRRLNRLLIRRYGLKVFSVADSAAPLDGIAPFDLAALPGQLATDFADEGAPDAFFFTVEMAERYIDEAVDKSRAELRAILSGGVLTDPADWAWRHDPV